MGYKISCTGVYTVYKPTPLFGPKTAQRGRGGGGLCSVVYGTRIFLLGGIVRRGLTVTKPALIKPKEVA